MLTNVVRGPICHAFSKLEQAGLTPRSEQKRLPSGKPNIVSIAAAIRDRMSHASTEYLRSP